MRDHDSGSRREPPAGDRERGRLGSCRPRAGPAGPVAEGDSESWSRILLEERLGWVRRSEKPPPNRHQAKAKPTPPIRLVLLSGCDLKTYVVGATGLEPVTSCV